MEARLDELESREAIRKLVTQYGHAIDLGDKNLMRQVFHEDSKHNHSGVFEGKSWDLVNFGVDAILNFRTTMHFLSNIAIDINGNSAVCESYALVYHEMGTDLPPPEFAQKFRAWSNEVWWVGLRYMDRLERREGVWKIIERIAVHDFEKIDPAAGRGFKKNVSDVPRIGPFGVRNNQRLETINLDD
jgi:hypothetical protein